MLNRNDVDFFIVDQFVNDAVIIMNQLAQGRQIEFGYFTSQLRKSSESVDLSDDSIDQMIGISR